MKMLIPEDGPVGGEVSPAQRLPRGGGRERSAMPPVSPSIHSSAAGRAVDGTARPCGAPGAPSANPPIPVEKIKLDCT